MRTYTDAGTNNEVSVPISYLLLPYVALAVAVILSQVLLFTSRILPVEKPEVPSKEPVRSSAKAKFRGRPKKEKPAEGQPKEVAREDEGLS